MCIQTSKYAAVDSLCQAAARVLCGHRRFELSAAFFLLGKATEDAIKVLMQQLEDPMLALLILRLLHAGEKRRAHTQECKDV